MNDNLNYEKEKEEEIIISNNSKNLTNDIFGKFCYMQILIKKESSLVKLCKKN